MDTKGEREIWNVFHDGSIVRAEGQVGDTVRVSVEIEYLREMFEEPGTSFWVELTPCESLSFKTLDSADTFPSLQAISSLNLEILSASEDSEATLKVLCLAGEVHSQVYGYLELKYGSSRVTLDTGRPVSVAELFAASAKYWDDWEARRGE